jgi:hypothetical protein
MPKQSAHTFPVQTQTIFLGKMQLVCLESWFRLLFLIYRMLPVYICHSGRFLQQSQ